MEDAAVGTGTDDGLVGRLRPVGAELVHELRLDLVFEQPRPAQAHGAPVGLDSDPG